MEKTAKKCQWNLKDILLQEVDVRESSAVEEAFFHGVEHFGEITSQINNAEAFYTVE